MHHILRSLTFNVTVATAGLLLVSTPVRAQSIPSLVSLDASAHKRFSAASVSWQPAVTPGSHPFSQSQFLLTANAPANLIVQVRSTITYFETPFAYGARVPIATLFRGRVGFAGFQNRFVMQDFLLGHQDVAAVLAGGADGPAHLLAAAPRSERSYGVQITVNWHAPRDSSGDNRLLQTVQRVLRAGRDIIQR